MKTGLCQGCRVRRVAKRGGRLCGDCADERRGMIVFRTLRERYLCRGCGRETNIKPCVFCAAEEAKRAKGAVAR